MAMATTKEAIFQLNFADCHIREPVQIIQQDFDSLFSDVREVLIYTSDVAEKCLLGKDPTATPDQRKPVPHINCSLILLKRIHCAVACVEDNSKLDFSGLIGNILPKYSGAGKAVMTLAAFALSYREFLSYVNVSQQLMNPFAIEIPQQVTAIADLNRLTLTAVQFIGLILDLENLSKQDHCIDYISEMTEKVKAESLTAIQVLVACMTQVKCLTYDMVMTGISLSSIVDVLNIRLKALKETIESFTLLTGESKAYSDLHNGIRRGHGIVQVISLMMYTNGEAFLDSWGLRRRVEVDVLKENRVLLFISEVEVSTEDYLCLKMIQEKIEKESLEYKIVWIPVARRGRGVVRNGWSNAEVTKINSWKEKMPWLYVVNYEATKPIVGIRYMKETWQFSYKPMVVVLNPQGAVECPDAIHMIRAWGPLAFPFNPTAPIPNPTIRPIIDIIIDPMISEEQYVLFYGGKNIELTKNFGINVKKLADAQELARAKVSLAPCAIAENNKVQFWSRFESMLCCRIQWGMFDEATKQIQKLLSFKEESLWAVLCQGSSVLLCSSEIIKDAVAEYKAWSREVGNKRFEICLREYLAGRRPEKLPCRHLPFESLSGWLPLDVECPDCGLRMERIVTYRCCHK